MRDPIVVFLGPTLAPSEASRHLDAVYLPPAEQGSVIRAVHAFDPRAIVLIDGSFGAVPAVRHKEILWALSRGTRVYGAGSMGALRAAELWPFGMQGFGFVYRWYRATLLADDDEVAVAMMPAELGAAPLGEALINMRLTFRKAERRRLISAALRAALVDLARSLHFVERSYPALFALARSNLPPEWGGHLSAVEAFVSEHAVDQKRDDAIGLLGSLAAGSCVGSTTDFEFRMTEAFAADLDAAGLRMPSDP